MKLVLDAERTRMVMALQNQCGTSLQYFDDEINTEDSWFNVWRQLWWSKARIGGLFLKYRDGKTDKKCPLCGEGEESTSHFLVECVENTHLIPDKLANQPDSVKWMLSRDRSGVEREWISRFIQSRWKERMKILESNGEEEDGEIQVEEWTGEDDGINVEGN